MFILDMSVNRNIGQGNQPPVQNTQAKSGEEQFNQFTKSKGNSAEDLRQETNKRTQLSRTRKTDIASRTRNQHQLFDVNDDSNVDEARVFVNLFVDGQPWTLRHVCYA